MTAEKVDLSSMVLANVFVFRNVTQLRLSRFVRFMMTPRFTVAVVNSRMSIVTDTPVLELLRANGNVNVMMNVVSATIWWPRVDVADS